MIGSLLRGVGATPAKKRWYLTEAVPSAGVLPPPDAEIEALYTNGNGMTVNVDGDLLVLMLVEWFEKDGWLIEGDDGKTMAIRASGEGPAGIDVVALAEHLRAEPMPI